MKHFFALISPKPSNGAVMLQSGFNSWLILITVSYTYLEMPDLGLNLTLPTLDLSPIFGPFNYHTGIEIPKLDIPQMNKVDFNRLVEGLPERVLDRPQFMPHNWPHLPEYSRWILVHSSHPLFKLSGRPVFLFDFDKLIGSLSSML